MSRLMVVPTLVLTVLSLVACSLLISPGPKYGRDFNVERMKVGLPVIEEDWKLYQSDRLGCVWVNPEADAKYDSHQPVHFSKSLDYRTGALVSEGDTYYGREDFPVDDGGTARENLGISYNFQEDDTDLEPRLGWTVWLDDRDGLRETTMQEAEQVLAKWGIPRLSYDFPPAS